MDHAFNLFDAPTPDTLDDSRPQGFRRLHRQIGPLIGASQIGATLYDLPPGQRMSAYHYEYNNEEWLIVIEGRPTLRTPTGEHDLRPGDVVAFIEGPQGAHTTTNHTDQSVRVLMVSTKQTPKVAVYPDSEKIAVWGIDDDSIIVKQSGATDYWDGERPSY